MRLSRLNDIKISEHFSLKEFECPCCGQVKIDPYVVTYLEAMRKKLDRPIYITSAYRCSSHNRRVGGVNDSYHIQGQAADIYVVDIPLDQLVKLAEEVGFTGIGIYPTKGFIHCDTGPKRRWKG